MRSFVIIALVTLIGLGSFAIGMLYEQENSRVLAKSIYQLEEPYEIEDAVKFLEYAEYTHQTYVENPEWCRWHLGTWEHHKWCVDNYTRIIALIKTMPAESNSQ